MWSAIREAPRWLPVFLEFEPVGPLQVSGVGGNPICYTFNTVWILGAGWRACLSDSQAHVTPPWEGQRPQG